MPCNDMSRNDIVRRMLPKTQEFSVRESGLMGEAGKLTFKEAIKQLRSSLGFSSQQAFANHLGVSVRTVAGWESGHHRLPKPKMLAKLRQLALEHGLKDIYRAIQLAGLQAVGGEDEPIGLQDLAFRPANDVEASVLVHLYETLRNPEFRPELQEILKILQGVANRLEGKIPMMLSDAEEELDGIIEGLAVFDIFTLNQSGASPPLEPGSDEGSQRCSSES